VGIIRTWKTHVQNLKGSDIILSMKKRHRACGDRFSESKHQIQATERCNPELNMIAIIEMSV
jgi:hypothetical protein